MRFGTVAEAAARSGWSVSTIWRRARTWDLCLYRLLGRTLVDLDEVAGLARADRRSAVAIGVADLAGPLVPTDERRPGKGRRSEGAGGHDADTQRKP